MFKNGAHVRVKPNVKSIWFKPFEKFTVLDVVNDSATGNSMVKVSESLPYIPAYELELVVQEMPARMNRQILIIDEATGTIMDFAKSFSVAAQKQKKQLTKCRLVPIKVKY